MPDAKEVNFSLKVVINKQKTKVLFAEADSDFVDVLLSFLTLPLGTIIKVLKNHYGDDAAVFGSLTSLYNGLANLSSDHFSTEGAKLMLLDPRSSFEAECQKLKLNVNDNQPKKYFACSDRDCVYPMHANISMYGTARCSCGKIMNREVHMRESQAADGDVGVFTNNTSSFVMSDDLRMVPNVMGFLKSLRNLGIGDTCGSELRNVTIGFNQVMDLLTGSLLSATPLTDLILHKRQMDSIKEIAEPGIVLHRFERGVEKVYSKSRKMNLKVILQKSSNKLLFAQAEDNFIDFLFSLLTIPLAGVECLLGSNTSLKNIDNLYRSIRNIDGDKYLNTRDMKSRLTNPKLPHGYTSSDQILPLSEECAPVLYYSRVNSLSEEILSPYNPGCGLLVSSLISPKDWGNYLKKPRVYMVTDDLTVTPLSMTSCFSILNGLEVPTSDVKELDLLIGLEEALSILKASLTSASALSHGLINSLPKQRPKQER